MINRQIAHDHFHIVHYKQKYIYETIKKINVAKTTTLH